MRASEADRLAKMAELKAELEKARRNLTAMYRSRPRRTRMSDAYHHAMHDTQYGFTLAQDVVDGFELSENAIRRLNRDIGIALRCHKKLLDDPYVCKQPWRYKEWAEAGEADHHG
jgi:hypothetical protein